MAPEASVDKTKYTLMGVSLQGGQYSNSGGSGHYIALARANGGAWWEFNDGGSTLRSEGLQAYDVFFLIIRMVLDSFIIAIELVHNGHFLL